MFPQKSVIQRLNLPDVTDAAVFKYPVQGWKWWAVVGFYCEGFDSAGAGGGVIISAHWADGTVVWKTSWQVGANEDLFLSFAKNCPQCDQGGGSGRTVLLPLPELTIGQDGYFQIEIIDAASASLTASACLLTLQGFRVGDQIAGTEVS